MMDATRRMRAWTDQAFLIPLVAVPAAWLASYVLYRWIIVCGGGGLFRCTGGSGLRALREPLAALPLEADAAVRIAHDVAARFAWQPTLVAFVVVALSVVASCWYLIHRSFQDSVPWYHDDRRLAILTNVLFAIGAVLVGLLSWSRFPIWIVHTEVLAPTLQAALGPNDPAVRTAEQIQHLLQVLASVAAVFVIGAASAALLTPIWTPAQREHMRPEIIADYTDHLADQWRRLSLTLYAGAALLVAAVVHQSTMYGWGNAFANAMAETRTLRVTGGKASLDSLNVELKIAQARVVLDTAQRAVSDLPARKARSDSLRREVAVLAFGVDSTRQALVRDSIGGGTREVATRATMVRIGELMTRAITRGGGLVYTILLAVTYLPAALVLVERAWELSFVAAPAGEEPAAGQTAKGGAKRREDWRIAEGVGFSLGDQWTRIIAVLSPVLASSGAVALAELFKLVSG
jgi:hypothetical protein